MLDQGSVYTFSYLPVFGFFTKRMTVPFFGLVQNFLLVIPVDPVKAPFKISPDQYRSNTWLVDGITLRVICSAILAASKALPNGFSPPFRLLTNFVLVLSFFLFFF